MIKASQRERRPRTVPGRSGKSSIPHASLIVTGASAINAGLRRSINHTYPCEETVVGLDLYRTESGTGYRLKRKKKKYIYDYCFCKRYSDDGRGSLVAFSSRQPPSMKRTQDKLV